MSLLADRHAVVTGGSSGIGAAVARRFAAAGATGTVVDRVEPSELPDGWDACVADVGDDASVASAFGAVERIDVVVAAAGVVPPWAGVADTDPDGFDDVLRVNARGVFLTIRHAAPRLPADGAIVAIASLNAWRGDPNIVAYAASKHAVLGIVRSAALDLGPRGIRVNAVAPGPVATDALVARMRARQEELGIPVEAALAAAAEQTALRRIATADDVAAAALFLASDLAAATTGHLLPVDGGLA